MTYQNLQYTGVPAQTKIMTRYNWAKRYATTPRAQPKLKRFNTILDTCESAQRYLKGSGLAVQAHQTRSQTRPRGSRK